MEYSRYLPPKYKSWADFYELRQLKTFSADELAVLPNALELAINAIALPNPVLQDLKKKVDVLYHYEQPT